MQHMVEIGTNDDNIPISPESGPYQYCKTQAQQVVVIRETNCGVELEHYCIISISRD